METTRLDLDCRFQQWQCSPEVAWERFAVLRRGLVLDGFKWDPQVGDESILARFALLLPARTWRQLAQLAEQLTHEALAAERELLQRPELLRVLGLPRPVCQVLSSPIAGQATPALARVFRFDFHPTAAGWRISEANSDVPGGYTEASNFSRLMAEHFPGYAPAGDPGPRLADVMAAALGGRGQVALLSATGYMEDQQITAYLAHLLRQRDVMAHLAHPRQVQWRKGIAYLSGAWHEGPLDAVLRFYQGEWLEELPAALGWSHYFRGGLTPVCNPGSALLIESKRFPLVWSQLASPLPTWKALLPETRNPGAVSWRKDRDWLLKTAFCNTGDTVAIRDQVDRWHWRRAAWSARIWPGDWVAQRRFEVVPLSTPRGVGYPCLGVYTINGAAAGIYGRISPRPIIDYAAVDLAVLIRTTGV